MKQTHWLWTPEWTAADDRQTRLVYFRRTLDWDGAPLTIRITADSRYKLYVNGTLACFGPAKGDDKVWFVDTLELSPYLHPGRNTLSAAVLRCGEDPTDSNHSFFRTALPGLYVEGLDEQPWRCRREEHITFFCDEPAFSPMRMNEQAAPGPNAGWMEAAFDDADWAEAVYYAEDVIPPVLRNLLPRPIPDMERIPGQFDLLVTTVPAHSRVSFVLDAGEELCAFLRLTVSGGNGAVVGLLQSECYQLRDGDGWRKGDRTDEAGELVGYNDWYTVTGGERERYEPFWFKTFRYLKVSITTADAPLTLRALDYEVTGYPLQAKTSVTTSDPTHAGIWDISLRTLRRCMHETYVDCPFYEQLQYAQDTRSEILYTYAVSADDRLARQAMDDFSRAQRPDGLLNCSYPNKNVNVIPGFSLYYILMVHDHMMYFGDKALVTRYLPTIRRILDYFAAHLTSEGLVDKIGGVNLKAPFWSFIDWAHEWLSTEGMPTAGLYGPLTMESLLYVLGLQKAAELADYVGEAAAAEDWRSRAAQVQRAVRAHCMDADGRITDGPHRPELSQHAQVFGILTGTLTPEEGRRNLLASMERPGFAQCTVAMQFYLFRALEQTGLYAYTDRYWTIWRRMLDNHCTTCVESDGYARSECHAWGALALYELPSVTLGVRPAAPGYEKIEVRPVAGYLTHASGTVHTPKGEIQVSWTKEAGELNLTVDCDDRLRERLNIHRQ